MFRGPYATFSPVVGNIAYAKVPASRRGIKLVAQNLKEGRDEGERAAQPRRTRSREDRRAVREDPSPRIRDDGPAGQIETAV